MFEQVTKKNFFFIIISLPFTDSFRFLSYRYPHNHKNDTWGESAEKESTHLRRNFSNLIGSDVPVWDVMAFYLRVWGIAFIQKKSRVIEILQQINTKVAHSGFFMLNFYLSGAFKSGGESLNFSCFKIRFESPEKVSFTLVHYQFAYFVAKTSFWALKYLRNVYRRISFGVRYESVAFQLAIPDDEWLLLILLALFWAFCTQLTGQELYISAVSSTVEYFNVYLWVAHPNRSRIQREHHKDIPA